MCDKNTKRSFPTRQLLRYAIGLRLAIVSSCEYDMKKGLGLYVPLGQGGLKK